MLRHAGPQNLARLRLDRAAVLGGLPPQVLLRLVGELSDRDAGHDINVVIDGNDCNRVRRSEAAATSCGTNPNSPLRRARREIFPAPLRPAWGLRRVSRGSVRRRAAAAWWARPL